MSRKGATKVREILPDPVYKHTIITKLINRVMRDGKKTVAQRSVYSALEIVGEKTKEKPVDVFIKAIANIRPRVEVRSRRVGGAAYQVPVLVRGGRQESLALRWLVASARLRSNSDFHTFSEKLAVEIIDAYHMAGGSINKKLEMEKIAEANKAFSHLRW